MSMKKPFMKRVLLPGLLLSLSLPSLASAQCTTDADCADGERCNEPLTLVECVQDPCPDPSAAGGTCVSELLGAACQVDADCGDGLKCLRLLTAECPEFDPACGGGDMAEGFCDVEGSDAVLAATTGLAPETATASDGAAAGGGAPAPTGGGNSSAAASSGCSVGGMGSGAATFGWLAVAALLLRRRRR